MKLTNKEFIKKIEKKYTFEKKPSVAVAVSGGPDSMSLLFLVNAFIKYKKGKLMALIVDHRIRKNSKKEAKKIIENAKKVLEKDIAEKKQKFNNEIEKEISDVEKEIKNLKKTSVSNINSIAEDISSEIMKKIIDTEINKSSVSAIVDDISKKKMDKYL